MKDKQVVDKIKKHSREKQRPDRTPYLSLSVADEKNIATSSDISVQQVQILALEHDITPERYARNQRFLSYEDQIKLLKCHVVIIGLGGLGGGVCEILARSGVGRLTLVDGDCFDESNLNRQLLSSESSLGKMKADVAAARVNDINQGVTPYPRSVFLTDENCFELLADADIAVDCLDNIDTRFLLEDGCKARNIPMVSGAIGGASGQVTTILPGEQRLTSVYGERKGSAKKGVEAIYGTMAFTAISIAALECAEVIALVTKQKAVLDKKILLADYDYLSIDLVDF